MGTVSWGVKMGCMARSHLRTKDKWGTAAALFCAGYVLSCSRGLIGKTHEQRVLRSAHGFPASSFSNAVYLGYHYSTYRSTNVKGEKRCWASIPPQFVGFYLLRLLFFSALY